MIKWNKDLRMWDKYERSTYDQKCDCYDNEICADRNLETVLKGSSIYGYGFVLKSESLLYIHFAEKLIISYLFLISRLVSDILSKHKMVCEER